MIFRALLAAFAVQVAGRLLDIQWHRTHDEFETGRDQVQAHWLVWLGTVLVMGVAVWALNAVISRSERRGYLTALLANAAYAVVAVFHFVQHVNHQEVDWTHVSLALTNIAAVLGIILVVVGHISARRAEGVLR